MAELVEDNNPVKDLYRRLLVDPNTLESARKYSFKQFEDKLLTDKKTQQTIGNYAVEAGIVSDIDSFNKQYILKQPVAPQQPPQPQRVSLAPPVEQSLTERTMGQAGIPLMPAQKVQQVPRQAPVGVYAPEGEMPMPTTDEMTREQLSAPPPDPSFLEPVKPLGVLAPEVGGEPQPQNIGEATREQIATPVTDAAEQETLRDIENSQKTWLKKTADEVRTMTAGGIRIGKTMLSTLGNLALKFSAGLTTPTMDEPLTKEREASVIKANESLYKESQKINKDFENLVKQTGIKTDVWEEIKKGNWDRVPEATIYTVATGAMQVIPALATFGTSTYLQTLPDAYANGVRAKADLLGITPEEVIASGQDDEIIAQSSALIQAAFDKLGLNLLSKSIAGKGAFRAVKDWIVNATGNKAWSRALGAAGGVVAAGVPEFVTGGAQETVATGQEAISGGKPVLAAIEEALPGRITSSAVGEAVGGAGTTGMAGVYRAATSGYSPLSKAPVRGKATQRADFDVVLIADKLNNRKKLIQAMESAVKNNPEAEGQIRNQYNKQIDALKIDDAQVAETYGAMDTIPDSPAKQKADQVMNEYLTEKGVIGQPEAAAPAAPVPPPPAPIQPQPITVQVPEPPPSENAQLDADIEAGQERTGFVFSSPLNSFSNQAKSILQSVREGKYIALTPAKQLLEELYDAYKIYGKQKESTARNLTMDQIDQGVADFEDALSTLGDYISKRDEGQFLRDFVGRKQQEEEQGVAQPEVSPEIAPDVTPLTETVAPGPVGFEVPSIQVQEGGENVAPVSQEAPQGEGQVAEQAVPVPAPVAEQEQKPTPKKMNFLGQEVNFYTNYIPSPENVEPDAVYTFRATSKEGLPESLQDRAQISSKVTNEVKGKKVTIENWAASINGNELAQMYEKQATTPTEETAPVEQAPESPISIRQFDAIKPTQRAKIKAFEDRNGPDAYKRMKKIKDDFENIMTKLSDKITQECP